MSSNCECKERQECKCKTRKCSCQDNDNLDDCYVEYLKPILYEQLFDQKSNRCNDYNLIVDKLTKARNAYFMIQSAIYNFVKDCTKLKQRIREDTSGSELGSLQYNYVSLINNFISQVAVEMRRKIKDDNSILLSFEAPPTQGNKTIENIQNIWPTNVIYTDETGVDTLVTSLPSVTIYLCENLQLQIKIISPKGVSYTNLMFDNRHVNNQCSKNNDVFIRNLTPSLSFNGSYYGFDDSEHANDLLEDIINYDCDANITTHQLKDVVDRLETICTSIENSHRTIIQKVKTEKLIERK